MDKVVLGIVDTPAEAQTTVERLTGSGFPPEDISVLFPDRRGSHDFAFEHHTKAAEGALAGVAIGAVLGAALGLVLGLGILVMPGLGAIAAAGPLLGALSGASVLGFIGALIGASLGLGVAEIQAKHYAGKIRTGTILVGVHASDRREVKRAREVLRSVAAKDVTATGEAAVPASARA